MKKLACLTLLLTLVATTIPAQNFPGDILAAGEWYTLGQTVARVNPTTGKLTTLYAGTTTGHLQEIVMAEDNSSFYVLSNANDTIYKLDNLGNLIATIHSGPPLSVPDDMMLDQNGDLIVADSAGLFKINAVTSQITTLVPSSTLVADGVTVDIDRGDLLVCGTGAMIHRYDIIAGTTAPLTSAAATSFRFQVEQDHASGLIYTGTCCSTASGGTGMMVHDPYTKASSVLVGSTATALRAWYAHRFDRRVNQRGQNTLLASVCGFGIAGTTSALVRLTEQGVITTMVSYGVSGSGILTSYGMEIEGSRNLSPILIQSPNDRQILVSFPAWPGRNYVAALGVSGIRPGVPLGDGRQIHLLPDPVTQASLQNLIPGIWRPGPGVLDSKGQAVMQLNANRLGKGVRGLPVWIAVAVVDPKASKGFAALAETLVIRLE